MKTPLLGLSVLALLLTSGFAVRAQDPAPLVKHTFATGVDGWTGAGDIARVDRTADPKIVRGPGKSALRFEYEVDKRTMNLLLLPVAADSWAKAGRIAFSVRASAETGMVVTLQETGGGRWNAVFLTPKDTWQDVVLDVGDFVLSRDGDSPADPNGRLDMDKVEGCSVLDIAQFFIRNDNPALKSIFPDVAAGPRTLYLADFEVRPSAVKTRLDGLQHPQIGWFGLGGLRLTRVEAADNPLKTTALQAKYTVGATQIGGMVRSVPEDALATAQTLSFSIAAEKSTTLLVQVEDAAGGKFNAPVSVPGLRAAVQREVALGDLKPTDDSKTQTLDRKHIKQILIVDPSGILEGASQENTLWLARLEAR